MMTYTNGIIGTSTFTTSNINCSYNQVETGRVEKSEISNQSFVNSYETFSPYTSYKIEFKISPLSNKNKNVEEIRQYCTECGTKVKKNYKFCPSCGNKI
jgi:hypothetical protein